MNDHLLWRYATKKFDPQKSISAEVFAELLDVLRLSPSSFGLQPWKFIVIENAALRKQLKPHAWNQDQITDASHLIVLCAKNDIHQDDARRLIKETAKQRGVLEISLLPYEMVINNFLKSLNPEHRRAWVEKQVYLALGMLLNECARRGIDACPMEGFDRGKFDDILGLAGGDFHAVVLCAIGYRAESDTYARQAKIRFGREEIFEVRSGLKKS